MLLHKRILKKIYFAGNVMCPLNDGSEWKKRKKIFGAWHNEMIEKHCVGRISKNIAQVASFSNDVIIKYFIFYFSHP